MILLMPSDNKVFFFFCERRGMLYIEFSGRLGWHIDGHGQVFGLRQCGILSGLSEIDFTAKEHDWMTEINNGLYRFNFRVIGGSYSVELEKNSRIQECVGGLCQIFNLRQKPHL